MKEHQKADKKDYYEYYRKRVRAVDMYKELYKELERYRKLVKPSIVMGRLGLLNLLWIFCILSR